MDSSCRTVCNIFEKEIRSSEFLYSRLLCRIDINHWVEITLGEIFLQEIEVCWGCRFHWFFSLTVSWAFEISSIIINKKQLFSSAKWVCMIFLSVKECLISQCSKHWLCLHTRTLGWGTGIEWHAKSSCITEPEKQIHREQGRRHLLGRQ